MQGTNLIRFVILLAPLALSAPAMAMCNAFDPNSRVVGYTAGPMGMPMPICVQNKAPRASVDNEPRPDPAKAMADGANAQVALMRMAIEDQQKLANDPQYQRLRKGYWEFGEPSKSGVGCSATFRSLTGMISVVGKTENVAFPVSLFTGVDIPAPKKPKQVRIDIEQDGQKIKGYPALNVTLSPGAPGTIAVPAADMAQLLAGIKDSETLKFSLDGKPIYENTYHGGDAMKARFQRCTLAGR